MLTKVCGMTDGDNIREVEALGVVSRPICP